MPGTPNTQFTETDLSHGVDQIPVAINGVKVKTKRGDLALRKITSWPQFEKHYGGIIVGEQGPTLAKRALDRGSALWVSRAMHYTDPADNSTFDANFAAAQALHKVTLAGALGAGHTITVTKAPTTISQPFTTSGIATLNALAAQLIAQSWVAGVNIIDATHLYIASRTATAIVVATSGSGAPAVTDVVVNSVTDTAGNILFDLVPKYPGDDYNNLVTQILPASNGRSDSFNLSISHSGDHTLNKVYTNLRIPGKPTVGASKYLDRVVKEDDLMNVVYHDLSGLGGTQVMPDLHLILGYAGGDDGAALTNTDYIGDSGAKTGLFAFDSVDEISAVAILDNIDGLTGVLQAGAAYADTRKDLKFFAHLGEEGDSEDEVAALRNALNIDTSYVRFFAGGLRHVNPLTGVEEWIPELGDVLGIAAYSEEKFGAYKSFAGKNRGVILNVLGAGNNWGARGNKQNLDTLAQAQINPVLSRDNSTYLLSNFTAQIDYSQLSFGNVRDLVIFIKKSLFPVIEKYQEEGNEPQTWKKMYLEVFPFFENLKDERALFDYRWEGDQFAKSVSDDDLIINSAADVALGIYKARVFIQAVVALREISIDITITPSSISFEDALSLTQP